MRYALFAACTLMCFLALAGPVLAQDTKARAEARFALEPVAEGIAHPWAVAFLPDGGSLVTSRPGSLWRISPDGIKTEVTGLPDNIFAQGQGGLLDIALEPGFTDGGWLYLSYAGLGEGGLANTEVARARLDLSSNALSGMEVIFRAQPKVKGRNHFGSRLLFSSGGHLYVTLGERFDYREEAQNISNHLGTVVRLNPDGSVPEDNPFSGRGDAAPEVFTFGNRNVQGIAEHPQTGAIWIHEHGPKGGDEINFLRAGANYGWPEVSFGRRYSGLKISDGHEMEGVTDPILQWTPSIAPSGMTFYTGDKFPQWQGDLFVGALAHRHLRRLEIDGQEIAGQEELLTDFGKRIRDVAQGPDGYLYVVTDEREGGLYRLVPASD